MGQESLHLFASLLSGFNGGPGEIALSITFMSTCEKQEFSQIFAKQDLVVLGEGHQ